MVQRADWMVTAAGGSEISTIGIATQTAHPASLHCHSSRRQRFTGKPNTRTIGSNQAGQGGPGGVEDAGLVSTTSMDDLVRFLGFALIGFAVGYFVVYCRACWQGENKPFKSDRAAKELDLR